MSRWADQDDAPSPAGGSAGRLETKPDKDGVKTVIEYLERDGKSLKITKRVRAVKVTHKVSPGMVARRSMPKFLSALEDQADVMSKMTQESEEVKIEPRRKAKDDEMADLVIGAEQKKSVWSKFRKDPEEKKEDEGAPAAAAAPEPGMPGRYLAPGARVGGSSSLNDLRAQEQRDRDALTLRVTNLSEDVREGDLAELFGQFGRTQRIFLAKNPETKQSKGFAFITYGSRRDCEMAIKRLNGHGYDNLVLRVEFSKPSAPKADGPGAPGGQQGSSTADFRAALNRPAF